MSILLKLLKLELSVKCISKLICTLDSLSTKWLPLKEIIYVGLVKWKQRFIVPERQSLLA